MSYSKLNPTSPTNLISYPLTMSGILASTPITTFKIIRLSTQVLIHFHTIIFLILAFHLCYFLIFFSVSIAVFLLDKVN
jgi:hypothetical protein